MFTLTDSHSGETLSFPSRDVAETFMTENDLWDDMSVSLDEPK